MLRKKQHKSEESLHVQAHDPFHARVKRKSHLPSEILILVSSHLMTCWSYCVGREGRGGGWEREMEVGKRKKRHLYKSLKELWSCFWSTTFGDNNFPIVPIGLCATKKEWCTPLADGLTRWCMSFKRGIGRYVIERMNASPKMVN